MTLFKKMLMAVTFVGFAASAQAHADEHKTAKKKHRDHAHEQHRHEADRERAHRRAHRHNQPHRHSAFHDHGYHHDDYRYHSSGSAHGNYYHPRHRHSYKRSRPSSVSIRVPHVSLRF